MTGIIIMKLSKVQNDKFIKLTSKSAKIRYLTSLNKYTRREIADKVQVIYQFVYNVQNQKSKSA